MPGHLPADAAELLDRHTLQNPLHIFRRDDRQPVRFLHVAGQFGQQFVGSDADGAGNSEAMFYAGFDQIGDSYGAAEYPERMGDIQLALIDGEGLYFRCVVAKYFINPGRGIAVFPDVADNDNQFRADPFPLPDRHAGPDPLGPGFVGAGGNNGTVTAADNRDRLASQFGVGLLLHRGEESVHVDMKDGSGIHKATYSEERSVR